MAAQTCCPPCIKGAEAVRMGEIGFTKKRDKIDSHMDITREADPICV